MRRLISFRDFDWLLLTFILIICSLGVLEIYSTTYEHQVCRRTHPPDLLDHGGTWR